MGSRYHNRDILELCEGFDIIENVRNANWNYYIDENILFIITSCFVVKIFAQGNEDFFYNQVYSIAEPDVYTTIDILCKDHWNTQEGQLYVSAVLDSKHNKDEARLKLFLEAYLKLIFGVLKDYLDCTVEIPRNQISAPPSLLSRQIIDNVIAKVKQN